MAIRPARQGRNNQAHHRDPVASKACANPLARALGTAPATSTPPPSLLRVRKSSVPGCAPRRAAQPGLGLNRGAPSEARLIQWVKFPPWKGLTTHQELSLESLPATETVWAARLAGRISTTKRRQSERQTVTKVKLYEPRNVHLPGSTASRCWKTIVGDRQGEVIGYPVGVVSMVCLETDEPGTREIRPGLPWEYAGRMGLTLRNANASPEVGPTDSTLSAGKPRTWGSGGTTVDPSRKMRNAGWTPQAPPVPSTTRRTS